MVWQKPSKKELRQLINEGFTFILEDEHSAILRTPQSPDVRAGVSVPYTWTNRHREKIDAIIKDRALAVMIDHMQSEKFIDTIVAQLNRKQLNR